MSFTRNRKNLRQLKVQTINLLGVVKALLEKIVVWVPPTGYLANLRIPSELRVVALERPESIRTKRIGPHLLGPFASILHRIQTLSRILIPLLWILHQPQNQVLCELHYKSHLSLLFLEKRNQNQNPGLQLKTKASPRKEISMHVGSSTPNLALNLFGPLFLPQKMDDPKRKKILNLVLVKRVNTESCSTKSNSCVRA